MSMKRLSIQSNCELSMKMSESITTCGRGGVVSLLDCLLGPLNKAVLCDRHLAQNLAGCHVDKLLPYVFLCLKAAFSSSFEFHPVVIECTGQSSKKDKRALAGT